MNVAILGTGKIGIDLLIKCQRSSLLSCVLFAGRRKDSLGIVEASKRGIPVSDNGIEAIIEQEGEFDLVFDATSAMAHERHSLLLKKLGKKVVNLTPFQMGNLIVPAINLAECQHAENVSLISCGGQGGIPLAHAISKTHTRVEYIEIVNTIASKSAGPATRLNIDEYVDTTEYGIRKFTQCPDVKTILILNPADPCINMKTTVSAIVSEPHIEELRIMIDRLLTYIQKYVPGYRMIVPPVYTNRRIITTVEVIGAGDYLPTYAGNLDIITCAAIAVAEEMARGQGIL